MKRISSFILVALILTLGFVVTTDAQIIVRELNLTSASNLPYFKLKNSTGDSTYTTAIDITKSVASDVNGRITQLYPDSIYVRWITSADSVYSVSIRAKYRSNTNISTYYSTHVDSVTSATSAVTRGFTKITRSYYTPGIIGGFGISLLAAATGNGLVGGTGAGKIYVSLVFYYTAVK